MFSIFLLLYPFHFQYKKSSPFKGFRNVLLKVMEKVHTKDWSQSNDCVLSIKSSLSCSTVMSSLDQLVVDFKEMIRVREENHRLIEDLLVQRLRDEADLVTLALCTQEQSLLGEWSLNSWSPVLLVWSLPNEIKCYYLCVPSQPIVYKPVKLETSWTMIFPPAVSVLCMYINQQINDHNSNN